jgi:hypothetical protein
MTPDKVSEVERMKRQSQFYFDFDGWQKLRDQEQEHAREMGIVTDEKKKKVTKKDVVSISHNEHTTRQLMIDTYRNDSKPRKKRRDVNINWHG